MSAELTFQVVNLAALPFWLLMLLAPAWRVTRWVMEYPWGPGLLAAVYAAMALPGIANILPALMNPDLCHITTLLGTKEVALVAWVHFLAFDLFVGRWEYLDAQERGLSHWLLAPCLVLTLMLGPLGLLVYLGARRFAPEPGGAVKV